MKKFTPMKLLINDMPVTGMAKTDLHWIARTDAGYFIQPINHPGQAWEPYELPKHIS